MKQSAITVSLRVLLDECFKLSGVSKAIILAAPSKWAFQLDPLLLSRSMRSNLMKKCIDAKATSLPAGSRVSRTSRRWPMAFCLADRASISA